MQSCSPFSSGIRPNTSFQVVADLSKAFALCAATDEAKLIRDDVSFFQAVRAALMKSAGNGQAMDNLDQAIRQLVSEAITADEGVIDVFSAAGLKKPDISILSDEFLSEVRGLKHKNVAAELLAKLLRDEISKTSKRNVVLSRKFSEMLQRTMNSYHNRAVATQEIIEELIRLAKEMSAAAKRGEDLGLNEDEICFYDALAQNQSAIEVMGTDQLKVIGTELVSKVTSERHDRLELPGVRPRTCQGHREAYPPQVRISPRSSRRGRQARP